MGGQSTLTVHLFYLKSVKKFGHLKYFSYLCIENMDIEEVKENLRKEKEQRYQNTLEYWKNRKPFKNEDDIPPIPIVKKEDYDNIIIPNIIRCGGIPKDKLTVGKTYIGDCRNANEATWNGKRFTYMRTKFGNTYEENINHFQDDDGYDVFVPIKEK